MPPRGRLLGILWRVGGWGGVVVHRPEGDIPVLKLLNYCDTLKLMPNCATYTTSNCATYTATFGIHAMDA